MEKPRDHARLLHPDEIDGLDTDRSTELSDFSGRNSEDNSITSARLRDYEGSHAYHRGKSGASGGGIFSSILSRFSPKTIKNAIIGVALALLLILVASMLPHKRETVVNLISAGHTDSQGKFKFDKPKDIHISGVIFYGRAKFVDVLDCYLQKNLAVNGGLLDDVLFMENTDNKDDLKYMHELVAKVPQYKKIDVERPGGTHGWGGFDSIWTHLQADKTIYLKIDDDIVWIDDDAVPRMISTLLEHPEAHDIAGNIINSPLTNWMHYHNDAVHPFLPEMSPPPGGPAELTDWRVSKIPEHDGNMPDKWDWGMLDGRTKAHFDVGDKGGPPFEGHRWLPLKNESGMLLKTPIEAASWDAFGRAWKSWSIAAQQHYSLLQNIENNELDRYYFGRGKDGVFNMQYQRYNLNFLAIWGESVAMQLPKQDDEQDLTVTIPLKFKRPCLINTRALVAHYNFGTQPEMQHTDLLERYRLYANEHICAANNQKKPFPPPSR